MRDYEVTIIIQPQLDDELRTQLIQRVSDWIANGQEENQPAANHWGMRDMAYMIDGHKKGYYVLFDAQIEPSRIVEISQNLKFAEDVIRHLIVVKEAVEPEAEDNADEAESEASDA